MSERWANFVLEGRAPDREAGFGALRCGRAGLDDEGGNGAVEWGKIVKAGGAEGEEVLL